MPRWEAREWLSTLMDVEPDDLEVRSIDRYGDDETQVRYQQGGIAVARLTVIGPVRDMLVKEGDGHWEIKAQIGSGTAKVQEIELPELDEIVY